MCSRQFTKKGVILSMSIILQEVINKVNELFIDTRYKHLVQMENGEYITSNTKDNSNRKAKAEALGKKYHPYTSLADWKIKLHLEGKKTMGVFGTSYGSKFLTFDVDYQDLQMAKWTTLKVVNQLIELGVPEKHIYVSTSGSKGFHVDLYFNRSISNKAVNKFYQLVMKKLDFTPNKDSVNAEVVRYMFEGGMVEQRPVGLSQGVKLPLGVHQKSENKNRCWYVDVFNRFTPYETIEYVLEIEKMDAEVIYTILEETQEDLMLMEEKKQVAAAVTAIEGKYKPLAIYKQSITKETTVELFERLEKQGLQSVGTRHKTVFKLAIYYKHLGMNQEETVQALNNWMSEQDTRNYTTPYEECVKDNKAVADYVFKKNCTILTRKKAEKKDCTNVSYEEMVEILKAKSKNQKLLLFSMLIHSKHYANKEGVFFMTYKQMHEATTLTEKNARINTRKLQEQGLINIVSTNVKRSDSYKSKPNNYMVNIEATGDKFFSIDFNDAKAEIEDMFNRALVNLVPLDYVKEQFPRRHYEEVRKLYVA